MRKEMKCIIAVLIVVTVLVSQFMIVGVSAAVTNPRDKTLVETFASKIVDPTNFNYMSPGNPATLWGLNVVYELLFYFTFATGEIKPGLATEVTYTDSTFTTLRVSLRTDVRWSDGEPFTADDIVFTYNDLYIANAPTLSGSGAIAGQVTEVVKIDDYTVDFILTTSNPRFKTTYSPLFSTFILPKHIWEPFEDDPLSFKNNPPIGTGAYVLVDASETRVLYKRNDDYWAWDAFGVRPAVEYKEHRHIAGGATDIFFMMAASNEIDIGGHEYITGLDYLALREMNPDIRTYFDHEPYFGDELCPRVLTFNHDIYPWNLKEVRWAVSYALDLEMIRESFFGGPFTKITGGLTIQVPPLAPEYRAIFDEMQAKYDSLVYDPAKSIEIFEGLGFTRGDDGVWVTPNGTRLDATVIGTQIHGLKALLTVIAANLNAVGIDATYEEPAHPTWVERKMVGDFEIAFTYACPGMPDPYWAIEKFHSKYAVPIGESSVSHGHNVERFENAELDAILDEWVTYEADSPESLALFEEALEIYMSELPVISMHEFAHPTIHTERYWTNWPSEEDPYGDTFHWVWNWENTVIGQQTWDGDWIRGLVPTEIDYVTVYFTNDIQEFRDIDLNWMGPFDAGDAQLVSEDTAEFLLRKELATYSPSTAPGLLEELASIKTTLEDLVSQQGDLVSQQSTMTIASIVLGIAVLALAVALVFTLRKP